VPSYEYRSEEGKKRLLERGRGEGGNGRGKIYCDAKGECSWEALSEGERVLGVPPATGRRKKKRNFKVYFFRQEK